MRRLLIFAYFYPPLAGGGVHRVLSFTRHLPAHGWACTVVCAGERDFWVTDDSLVAAVPDDTHSAATGVSNSVEKASSSERLSASPS